MRPNLSITISLPEDIVELVEKKVASGEVVAEGLRYLADNDAEIEQWLRDEVVPAVAAHDPSKAIPLDEMRRRVNAHMDASDKEARFPK